MVFTHQVAAISSPTSHRCCSKMVKEHIVWSLLKTFASSSPWGGAFPDYPGLQLQGRRAQRYKQVYFPLAVTFMQVTLPGQLNADIPFSHLLDDGIQHFSDSTFLPLPHMYSFIHQPSILVKASKQNFFSPILFCDEVSFSVGLEETLQKAGLFLNPETTITVDTARYGKTKISPRTSPVNKFFMKQCRSDCFLN